MQQPPFRRYDVVLFDAGYTLLRPVPSPSERYARICRTYGGADVERNEMVRALRRVLEEFPQPGPDSPLEAYRTSDDMDRAWWREYDRRVFRRFGVPPERLDAAAAEMYVYFSTPTDWEVYREAYAILETLRAAGVIMGICSNWSSGLHRVIEGLDLKSYFAFVHTSADVGEVKPGRRMFDLAIQRTGAAPDRVLHVGDTYHADVVGAERAGICAVLLDRWKRAPDNPCSVIADLPDLLPLLES